MYLSYELRDGVDFSFKKSSPPPWQRETGDQRQQNGPRRRNHQRNYTAAAPLNVCNAPCRASQALPWRECLESYSFFMLSPTTIPQLNGKPPDPNPHDDPGPVGPEGDLGPIEPEDRDMSMDVLKFSLSC